MWCCVCTYEIEDFHCRHALTNKENFNHLHAKLSNVIERVFGVLKHISLYWKGWHNFRWLHKKKHHNCMFAFHNFIKKESLNDEFFLNTINQLCFNTIISTLMMMKRDWSTSQLTENISYLQDEIVDLSMKYIELIYFFFY